GAGQVDDGGGSQGTRTAIDDGGKLIGVAIEDGLRVVHGFFFAFRYQGGRHQGRARGFDQGPRYRMVGYAYAYGLARWMGYPARHFAGGLEDKGPRTGRRQFEEAVLLV